MTGDGIYRESSVGVNGTSCGGGGNWESRARSSPAMILPKVMVLSANAEALVTTEGLFLWDGVACSYS